MEHVWAVKYGDHIHVDFSGQLAVFQTRREAAIFKNSAELSKGDLRVAKVTIIKSTKETLPTED